MDIKPVKTIKIADGLDWRVILNQYDNGDGVMFYQLAISLDSDTGSSAAMNLGLEGDFSPANLGKELIKLEK
jgi:hypothetical protein